MHKKSTKLQVWIKTQRKFRRVQEQIAGLSRNGSSESNVNTSAPISHLNRKLDLLCRRLISMNKKWRLGMTTSILMGWMFLSPYRAYAQFPSVIDLAGLDRVQGFTVDGHIIEGGSRLLGGGGDVHGDGIDDFFVSNNAPVKQFIIPATETGFPPNLDVADLDGSNGFVVNGINSNDNAGTRVDLINDINGDGYDDLLISTYIGSYTGRDTEVYIVFGSESVSTPINLSSLNGDNGFKIVGKPGYSIGHSVSGVDDFNGDGFGDVILQGGDKSTAYVLFGKETFPATFDISTFSSSTGTVIFGVNDGQVSGIGDFNNDGLSDVLVRKGGSPAAAPPPPPASRTSTLSSDIEGDAFLLFGRNDGLDTLKLENLTSAEGIVFMGNNIKSVGTAGDVNFDGFDDVTLRSENGSTEVFIVFGRDTPLQSIDLALLNGTDGFVVTGVSESDEFGPTISTAGDINNDNIDDIIIGAERVINTEGEAYVIFGSSGGFSSSISVSSINGTNGIVLKGETEGDRVGLFGSSVANAGDVNDDGINDIIVGARGSLATGAYVIFGNAALESPLEMADLDGTNGFVLDDAGIGTLFGASVSGSYDFNGDGVDDVAIGAPRASVVASNREGQAYVVFGKSSTTMNNPPILVSPINDFTVALDSEFSLVRFLNENFRDPDQDPLSFSAVSSHPGVVTVNVSDESAFTYDPVSIGNSTITVTADDGNGGSASDTFVITVIESLNTSPVVANPISDQSFIEGFGTEAIALANVFTDADQDALTYSVSSSDEAVVTVSEPGGSLTITEVGRGTATIMITANDGNGGSVTDEFNVTVEEAPNNPPIIEIPLNDFTVDLSSSIGLAISFEDNFSDPDGDVLTYAVSSSNTAVVTVSISTAGLLNYDALIAGESTITVTVSDGNGGSVSDDFVITVIASLNNSPIVANPIPDQELTVGFSNVTLPLAGVFTDSDEDELTYSVSSSDEAVVTVSESGGSLTITEVGPGTATIMVTTNDGNGGTAEDTFEVTLVPTITGRDENDFSHSVSIFPNPVKTHLTVVSDRFQDQEALFQLLDLTGRHYDLDFQKTGMQRYDIDLSTLQAGMYILLIEVDGKLGAKTITK